MSGDDDTRRPSKREVARSLLLRGTVFLHLDPRTQGVVVPEYLSPRVGCRVFQGAYGFLDLGAACVSPASR